MRIFWVLVGAVAMIGVGGSGCSSTSKGDDAGAAGGSHGMGGTGEAGGHNGSAGGAGSGGSPGLGGQVGSDGGNGTGGSFVFDGGAVDAGSMTCTPACGAGLVCVGTGTEGGAVMLADAGVCPVGTHLVGIGNICTRDLTYACMTIPTACGTGTPTCACASTLCPASHICRPQSDGALQCVEQVP